MSKQGVESPCVRNCCLDEKDICMGCGRHLDEITGWRAADEAEKTLILERAKQRLEKRQKMVPLRELVTPVTRNI